VIVESSDSHTALDVRNVQKDFKVYNDLLVGMVKEKLFFWKKEKYYRNFTALHGITFKIDRGEVVGLIGPNGSGKTTLLKILSGIMMPTSGSVSVSGSLVAVLALGLGFNPRFTGRENIVIGASMLGMSLAEIKEKENWIIEFSELRDFIDQPVRTYSSGMWARLSFSVAASVSPDILIIDEALATGDAFFVQKSLGRIHEICKSGTTALFVSHNMMQIQRLCSQRVLLLEQGQITNDDKAHKVIGQYNDLLYRYREQEALKRRDRLVDARLRNKDFTGNGDVVIEKCFFVDGNGSETSSLRTGQYVELHLFYTAYKTKKLRLVIQAVNYSGICAFAFQTNMQLDTSNGEFFDGNLKLEEGRGVIVITFDPLLLTTNLYLLSVYLTDPEKWHDGDADFYDMIIFQKENFIEFSVFKPYDLDETRIFEHPATCKVVETRQG
jgi:ABC-type polysaccharide/polyol phosphate transport system ATPase subunit